MNTRAGANEGCLWGDADSDLALQRCRSLLETIDDGIYHLDADGCVAAVNDVFLDLTGYPREELLGEHISLVLDADDPSVVAAERAERQSATDTDEIVTVERTITTADGGAIPCDLRINHLTDDDGYRGTIGIVRRRGGEDGEANDDPETSGDSQPNGGLEPLEPPQQLEESLTTILDEADIGVVVLDNDLEIAWADATIERYFGIDRNAIRGRDSRQVVDETMKHRLADADRFAETVSATYDDNSYTVRFDCRVTAGEDRAERWLEHYSKPIESGEYAGGRIELYYDITDRKRSEGALRGAEERFQSLVDAVEEYAIFRLDPDGNVITWNEGAQEIKGYEEDDILGEHFSTFYTAADREAGVPERNLEQATADGSVEDEGWRVRTDGSRFWANVTITAVFDDDGTHRGYLKVTRDMTDRYEREQELEHELQQILGRVSDGFYAVDDEFRYTHVNARAEELLGYDADELRGEKLWDVFPEVVGSDLYEQYRTVMETQEPTSFERYSEPLGIWAEVNVYPSETGLSVYFRDISERKAREQDLERTERRFEAIFNDPNILVGLLESDGTVVDINGTAMEYIDADLADVTGELFWETPWWGDGDAVQPEVKEWTERAAAGEYVDFEADLTRPDGQRYTLSGYFRPVTDDDGEVVSIIVSDRDITERKERERQLEESEQRYRTLAEYFPNGLVTLFDHDLEYTLAAGQGFDRIPVEPSDLEGRQFDDVWPDETAAELEPAFQAALNGEERSVELEYAGREWILHAVPITDERGDVFAGMTMAQDITEQKERERYLEDAKAQLEAATEAGAVGTWEWQVTEDEFVAGASFARTFGIDPEDAREGVPLERLLDAIHEDDRERVAARIEEAVETGGEYEEEYRVWNADGELRWVVARGHVECDEDGNAKTFPGALTDITKRKRTEIELQRNKEQLQSLFEILPVGVVVADRDGEVVEVNNAAREIWGGDVLYADSLEEADGFPVWWADTGESVERDEWPLTRVLEGEEITDPGIFDIEAADGEQRILSVRGMPIRNERGTVTRGVITLTDITERRQSQRKLEATVDKLEESNERLEQFAYAASHDLQEPLRMVTSYLQLLENRYADAFDEDGQEFLEFAVDGAERMREMIQGLLEYSRVETRGDPFEPVELERVFDDVRENLQLQIEECDAEITVDDLPQVHGDASQLRQVLQNLLSNAITYSGDEPPRVHVSAERREAPRASERSSAELRSADRSSGQRGGETASSGTVSTSPGPREDGEAAENVGDEWLISVEDEGIGIDPEDQERIFTVFDRLHSREEYDGTGIGLALCQRIVERHDGDIWVDSEPGEGATFSFTVPAADES